MSSIVGFVAGSAAHQPVQQPAVQTKATSAAASPFLSLPLPTSIQNDLSNLSTALEKENMHAAQTAFSNLLEDINNHYRSQREDLSTISLLG